MQIGGRPVVDSVWKMVPQYIISGLHRARDGLLVRLVPGAGGNGIEMVDTAIVRGASGHIMLYELQEQWFQPRKVNGLGSGW